MPVKLSSTSATDRLQRDILEAINHRVAEAREEVIVAAVKEFEARILKIVGETAVTLANYYTLERTGGQLIIRVQIEEPKKS